MLELLLRANGPALCIPAEKSKRPGLRPFWHVGALPRKMHAMRIRLSCGASEDACTTLGRATLPSPVGWARQTSSLSGRKQIPAAARTVACNAR